MFPLDPPSPHHVFPVTFPLAILLSLSCQAFCHTLSPVISLSPSPQSSYQHPLNYPPATFPKSSCSFMYLWDVWECESPTTSLLCLHVLLKMDGDLSLETWLRHSLLKTELAKSKLLIKHSFLSPFVLPVWRVGLHLLFRLLGPPSPIGIEPCSRDLRC